MKKIFMMTLAAVAISLTSCGNKTNNTAAGESTDNIEANATVKAAVENTISVLAKSMEAKDAAALQQAVEEIKQETAEFLANNPEEAKEYLTQVQAFLKENTKNIKTALGENAIASAAVNALANTPADDIIYSLNNALNAKATEAAATGEAAVENAESKAAEKVNEAAEKAARKVQDKTNEARDKAVEEAKTQTREAAKQAGKDLKKELGF